MARHNNHKTKQRQQKHSIAFYSPIYLLNYFNFGTISPFLNLIRTQSAQNLTPFDFPHCPYIYTQSAQILLSSLNSQISCFQFFISPNQVENLYPLRNPFYWMETGRKPVSGFVHVRLFCSFEFLWILCPKNLFQYCTLFERMNEFQSFAFAFGSSYGTGSLVSRFRILGRIPPPIQLTLSSCKKGFQCTSDKAPPKNKRNICNRSHNLTI